MKIHNVEQGSPEWRKLRIGKPSASEFTQLVTPTGKKSTSLANYAIELANELYTGATVDAWEGSKYSERGKTLEDAAIALYELQNGLDVKKIGFVTDDDEQYGCSPDGEIGDDGLIEVKCQKGNVHTKAIMLYEDEGKPDPKHNIQCQGQLFVTGRKWVDLVHFHPDLRLHVARITPDEKIFAIIKEQLAAVILERDRVLQKLRGV